MGTKKIKTVKSTSPKPIVLEDTYIEQVRIWAEKHFLMLVGIAAALLFVVITTWGIKAYGTHKESKAQAAYGVIASKIPAEDKATPAEWEKLIPELQKVASEHKGTQPGLLAMIELSRAFFETKRYGEAVNAASDALKSASPGHTLYPLIQYQLAYAYEAAGKSDEASKVWEQLKEAKIASLQREADWNIGRNFAERKEFAKAAEVFEKAAGAQGAYPAPALLGQELARAKQQVAGK